MRLHGVPGPAIVAALLLLASTWADGAAVAAAPDEGAPALDAAYTAISHRPEPETATALGARGIYDPDERTRVAETAAAPYSMVTFLTAQWRDGSTSTCSGFVIGTRTVATAGHCVYRRGGLGWARQVTVAPGANGAARPFGTTVATEFHTLTGWAAYGLAAMDIAALTLPEDVGARTGAFQLRPLSDAALAGGAYTLAGYPGDKDDASLWVTSGRLDRLDDLLLYTRLDMTSGNSGGPVWERTADGYNVIGIAESVADTTNVAVRISPQVAETFRSWIGRGIAAPSESPGSGAAAPARTASDAGAAGRIVSGAVPADGGVGLIVFGGGSSAQLLAASGCPVSTAAFWASKDGGFVTYVPGTTVAAVNAGWIATFPNGIPANIALMARCR